MEKVLEMPARLKRPSTSLRPFLYLPVLSQKRNHFINKEPLKVLVAIIDGISQTNAKNWIKAGAPFIISFNKSLALLLFGNSV